METTKHQHCLSGEGWWRIDLKSTSLHSCCPEVSQSYQGVHKGMGKFSSISLLCCRLCTAIDDKLSATVDDAKNFIMDVPDKNNLEKHVTQVRNLESSFLGEGKSSTAEAKNPFDRFGDAKEVQSFLQETCFATFSQ